MDKSEEAMDEVEVEAEAEEEAAERENHRYAAILSSTGKRSSQRASKISIIFGRNQIPRSMQSRGR